MSERETGVTAPPFHPWCRCVTAPYYEDLEGIGDRFARDENGEEYSVPKDMSYEEWKKNFVDGDEKTGIINTGTKGPTIHSIDSPIEQRNTGRGKPGAILHYDVDLNSRQQRLLDELPEYDSRVTVNKKAVSMTDLSALTAKTGDEFAMFTKSGERLVIRGNPVKVQIGQKEAIELAEQGYRWSGHTHPGVDRNCLVASRGDVEILKCFKQAGGCVYNSVGEHLEFRKE